MCGGTSSTECVLVAARGAAYDEHVVAPLARVIDARGEAPHDVQAEPPDVAVIGRDVEIGALALERVVRGAGVPEGEAEAVRSGEGAHGHRP